MQSYEMPADTSAKEKSIGGVLTFEQGGIIGGFTILGFLVLLGVGKLINIIVGVIFLIPFPILGVFFAFKKVMDMPIYRYWRLKAKFNAKTKFLVHINEQKPLYEEGL